MAKNTMKALEEFILLIDRNEIDVEDVLYSFWDDTEDLEDKQTENSILIKVNCQERRKLRKRSQKAEREELVTEVRALVKERERLRGMVERRRQKVLIAFNQLFLAGKVRAPSYHPPFIPYTFSELVQNATRYWQERIQSLQKEQAGGKDMRLYLGDAWHWFEQVKDTQILRRSKMEPWLKSVYKPRGELICVGSYLYMHVWPERISKANHSQAWQLSLF